MAGYFDPSPRSSKRRRTASYTATKSTLENRDTDASQDTSVEKRPGRPKDQADDVEDSAYGSKEDSFAEDSTSLPQDTRSPELHNDDNQDAEDTITVQPRSSGRERKKPRRYSLSPEPAKQRKVSTIRSAERHEKSEKRVRSERKQPSAVETTPKGILTPSRKQRGTGLRKSVVFDQDEKEIGEQFGFKDINEHSAPRSSKSKLKEPITVENDEAAFTPSKTSRKQLVQQAKSLPEPESDPMMVDDEILVQHINDIVDESVSLESSQGVIDEFGFDDDPALLSVTATILARLVSHGSVPVPSYLQTQYDALHSLLRATVTTGESNSMLLLGARGTGKSHLFETAISDLTAKYQDDFHTVRLNGFYQTDDKLALREIWRQLGREMQVDEMETGEAGGSSYADTMSSLLSLLSHPDEFLDPTGHSNPDGDDPKAVQTTKSIIFVLDEFDLFTTHPRQTLLYNLFDIAQSKKAPIAVIGCSTRMDVVDCLEKRVKSRFSHRWVHVPSARTLNDFEQIIKNALCFEEQGIAAMKHSKGDLEMKERWNSHIQTSFLPSSPVQGLIRHAFYTTKSIPELFTALHIPIATIQLSSSIANDAASKALVSIGNNNSPTLLSLLSSLPTLHLALLIAASRLDTIHNLTTLNFNLVYAHYVELISRSKLQVTASGAVAVGASLRQWTRDTAKFAWEDLGTYECIFPVSGVSMGAGSKDSSSAIGDSIGGEGASVRMWRVDVTLEDLDWALKEKWKEGGGVRDVLSKWCRDI